MRLTRNCKIDTKDLTEEAKELVSMLPDYDYARNELGFATSDTQQCLEKLGQIEDIEEELGINFITLLKALNNGIWVKYKRHFIDKEYLIEHYEPEDFVISFQKEFSNVEAMFFKVRIYGDFEDNDVCRNIEGDFEDTIYLSKNYGKTWALTKEELK